MPTRLRFVLASTALLLVTLVASGDRLRTATADGDIDVSVFYSALEPHGDWVHLEPYGWAWVPEGVEYGWRPYTVGQWSWVEPYGWTWISHEPWGWATYHYGRWTYVDDYGWAWLPGTTWGPAWVAFRYGNPYVGWAPLGPTPGWRFDAAFDVGSLNADVSLGAFAWSFVSLRYFAAPDVSSRLLVSAYNPYLVQNTQWSTRYAAIEGGYANKGIDVATVERAQGAPLPRRRLREAQVHGARTVIDGDNVVLYRPRVAPRAPAKPPQARVRVQGTGPSASQLEAWAAQRKAALQAHLDAQRKALEQRDALPDAPAPSGPGALPAPDDLAKRRDAAMKAMEEERKRLEALFERQRKRREQELKRAEAARQEKQGEGHGKKDEEPEKKEPGRGPK